MSLAVVKTGGKQYLVKVGDKIRVEKLPGQEGDKIKLDTILITDEKGEKVSVGKPLLESKVEASIIKQITAKKVLVVKYKAKTRYKRRVGHRQQYSEIKIDKI
ncbi:50S ribosomal protein L21 [Candidatus Falkowbacteria bacterium]|nr:50S ribosomal protein L21 [Candidatus Falkowbacteria bacterium]